MTDNKPNTFLQTQPILSRRQARWSEYLQRFHLVHRAGRHNVADPLSRNPAFKHLNALLAVSHMALLASVLCLTYILVLLLFFRLLMLDRSAERVPLHLLLVLTPFLSLAHSILLMLLLLLLLLSNLLTMKIHLQLILLVMHWMTFL